MLSLSLHQMRSGWARLIAAGLAIMLGTGFVAASIIGGEVMKSAAYQSFTSSYAGSDLVISQTHQDGNEFTDDVEDTIASTPGVESVENKSLIPSVAGSTVNGIWAEIGVMPSANEVQLSDGNYPRETDHALLDPGLANRLSVEVGDTVPFHILSQDDDEELVKEFYVAGLLSDGAGLLTAGPEALILPKAYDSPDFASATATGPMAVTVADGSNPDEVATQLGDSLGSAFSVDTVTELAENTMGDLTGETDMMRNFILGFAGVALAVAALVIGNTFSVLVAGRTRTLALLRTVGASKGQIRRSVLIEALLLGLFSSIAGLTLAYAIIAGAILAISGRIPDLNLWDGVQFTPGVWVTTFAVGLVVTLVASWAPARAATRVRPLEALRPAPVKLGTTAGKFRATISGLAFFGGIGLLVLGVIMGSNDGDIGLALLLGVGGGFISVFGVILGAVFVITPAVRIVGRLFGSSVPAQVATMGAVRNPKRTATTTNALFIGVGLVAMMATGAGTAKTTLDNELATTFPIDNEASTVAEGNALTPPDITQGQVEAVLDLPDVDAAAPVLTTQVELTLAGSPEAHLNIQAPSEEFGSTVAELLSNPEQITDLANDEVLLADWVAEAYELEVGDSFTAQAQGQDPVDLTVAGLRASSGALLTTSDALLNIDPDAPLEKLWINNVAEVDPNLVLDQIEDTLAATDGPITAVFSPAVERDTFAGVIDMMLLIVSALLAVAVLIALVGVANTLSLSVIERRRENATLRAEGLTTGQLRAMLAIEGVIIAVIGAIVGLIGGLAYGWAGAKILLSELGEVALVVPWGMIITVFLVAGLAGLTASVIPARSAVKVSPVAALAQE